jgi:uracil-DNA glycosylase family 4
MFTGDSSGDWLYAALHRAGLADRAESVSADDGLRLHDVFITATCRCAPPQNRPKPEEMRNCESFLDTEFDLMARLRVTVALGGIAWNAALRRAARVSPASMPRPRPPFGHGARAELFLRHDATPVWLLGSYHPSRQNTQTGRLTRPMLDGVIRQAVRLAGNRPSRGLRAARSGRIQQTDS